jgi:hypothetical protein
MAGDAEEYITKLGREVVFLVGSHSEQSRGDTLTNLCNTRKGLKCEKLKLVLGGDLVCVTY